MLLDDRLQVVARSGEIVLHLGQLPIAICFHLASSRCGLCLSFGRMPGGRDDILEQDQKVPVARAARRQGPDLDIDETKVSVLPDADRFSLDAGSRLAGFIDSPAQFENEFLPNHPEKLECGFSRQGPEIRTRVPAEVQDFKIAIHHEPGMPGVLPDNAVGLLLQVEGGRFLDVMLPLARRLLQ